MAREYIVPSLVVVPLDALQEVAHFLEHMIPTHAPPGKAEAWKEISDALHALGNDTDAIITDPDLFREGT